MHIIMSNYKNWQSNSTCMLLSLPKELLLEIITCVALESTHHHQLFPTSLLELSQCCKYLYHLVHKDPWKSHTLWPRAFQHRFDTTAIYRRRLNHTLNWKAVLQKRSIALYQCRSFALQPKKIELLDKIDWEIIWDILTEHDQYNIPHLLDYRVEYAAGTLFQLGLYRDREVYPVVLPILSLLVNYDFSITRFFCSKDVIVSNELSQFAYNFEADALITQHTPLRYFHSWTSPVDQQQPQPQPQQQQQQQQQQTLVNTSFYPAQDPLASVFHLFFTTIFANHPNIYQAIPGCIPIPLFPLHSELFDVEFLRRYERNLFFASLQESRQGWEDKQKRSIESRPTILSNIYADSGFASASYFVSEAHLIEGEWMGYYTFQDSDDSEDNNNGNSSNSSTLNHAATDSNAAEDWFDGPMRITIKIVPLEDASGEPIHQSSWLSRWLNDEEDDKIQEPNVEEGEPRKKRKLNNNSIATSINFSSLPSCSTQSRDQFPSKHLKTCPLTRFEGTGVDNLGNFTVTGLVDDTEEGQVTWEKTYIDSGETWEYSGRFAWPMGLFGRWGDEEYGGPWWMWKVSDNEANLPTISTATK
ncbi:uncharacterized protein B0P05DRAFT_600058 [Gilbertella persicaria]|uniref:uncharacterized protein n=1 Tax=Gilbertella persicaria TaxID=101096 RepID=UPI002220E1DF|nr:uncharacterized protein B0P05DRAFT_600058 [Gilbertella persicaria]KAI8056501.1 hypothetical protein B0P05DRAFT_600058 [Gilbertella persicaria]